MEKVDYCAFLILDGNALYERRAVINCQKMFEFITIKKKNLYGFEFAVVEL